MKEFWNDRYRAEDYAYGTEPNAFFKRALDKYGFQGKILLPAEGEGRNAVYAAKKGLEVFAFDISEAGKEKAIRLAKKEGVKIHYKVGDFSILNLSPDTFEVAALIYAHFPPDILSLYHQKVAGLVKPGGIVILEGFSKNNLELREKDPSVGGPNNVEMLFSTDEIRTDFSGFEIITLVEEAVELREGNYHNGMARVVRFIGKKTK